MFINISISIMKFRVGGVLIFLAMVINQRGAEELVIFVDFVIVKFLLFCSSTVFPATKNIIGDTSPCLIILIIDDFSDLAIEIIFTSIIIICLTEE